MVFLAASGLAQASVYGKRAGSIRGLAVVHKDKANTIRATKGWKLGVVADVMMLARAGMFKPEASRLHSNQIISSCPKQFGENYYLWKPILLPFLLGQIIWVEPLGLTTGHYQALP